MKKFNLLLLCLFFLPYHLVAQQITSSTSFLNDGYDKSIVDRELKAFEVFHLDLNAVPSLQSGINGQIEAVDIQLLAGEFNTTIQLFNAGLVPENYKRVTTSGSYDNSPVPSPMVGFTEEGYYSRITINQGYVHGFILTDEGRYYIDPMTRFDADADAALFVLYNAEDAEHIDDAFCGTQAIETDIEDEPEVLGAVEQRGCYEVEYALAADYSMYQKYGSISNLENHIFGVTNDMQTNYSDDFDEEIVYVIVETYVVDCSGCDPWTGSTNPGTFLESFSNWARGSNGFSTHHDIASCWTNRNFDNGVVGIAWVNVMCRYNRYNCLQDFSNNSDFLRVCTAHELGHNWGALHDAQGAPYIMAPSVSNANQWSTTSRNVINNTIASKIGGTCLEPCDAPNPPIAGFSADYTTVCAGSYIQFFDESENGEIEEFEWTFTGGQPSSSTERNPLVRYSSPGTYSVGLKVTSSGGSDNKMENAYIYVGNGDIDFFEVFTFENSMQGWDVEDDGNNGTFKRVDIDGALGDKAVFIDNYNAPSHTYDRLISPTLNFAGRENVFMQLDYAVAGSAADNDSLIVYVSKDDGLSYTRVFDIKENGSGNYATATASGSFVPNTENDWCINHNGRGQACLQIDVSDVAGYGKVKVMIEQYHQNGNNLYIDKIAFRSLCYEAQAPQADFTADVTEGCAPVTVQFTDLSSQSPDNWSWSFPGGNPNSSNQENPLVTYYQAGVYDVFLTVSNSQGSDDIQKYELIVVDDIPFPSFTYEQDELQVIFTNTSTDDADGFFWEFGDGNTSSSENPVHNYAEAGTYTVILTVFNHCGEDTYEQEIELIQKPIADFSVDKRDVCMGESVQFIDFSINADTYFWTFDGGTPSTSTDPNPVVTYHEPGNYDVSLSVENSAGSDILVLTDFISVMTMPTAGFTYSINNDIAIFTNTSDNASSFHWDFGDGNSSNQESPVHVYEAGGVYTVILIASNECGNDTVEHTLEIINAPIADFTADPLHGCSPLVVEFNADSPSAESYEWSFPGGNPSSSSEENVIVTYNTPGKYDVILQVTNSSGNDILERVEYITVTDIPYADFQSTVNGMEVQFNNTSENADEYVWDFGDGMTSTEVNPVHIYAESGTYNVTLTAINECGDHSFSTSVSVLAIPQAGFIADVTSGCALLVVQFTDNSVDADSYKWTFEGGTPATSHDPNPTVEYNTAGVYDVTLTVENAEGEDILVRSDYIEVNDVPTADFVASTDGLEVQFSNMSQNADSYHWDFGDGEESTSENPTHQYAVSGEYTVTLSATNECGTVTYSMNLGIGDFPNAQFTASSTEGCIPFTVTFENLYDGDVTDYKWTFEGGNPETSTSATPSVTYESIGSYDVLLIVENGLGSDTILKENFIHVGDIPTSDFTYMRQNLNAQFTENIDGSYTDLYWDFGDGNTATSSQPEHTYTEYGTYTVTLIASNTCGSDTSVQMLNLPEPAAAAFSPGDSIGCAPFTVQMENQSTGDDLNYYWTFDGGQPLTSTEKEPLVTYNQPGTYTISLVVSNSVSSDTLVMQEAIEVRALPIADFNFNINGDTVQFNNLSKFAEAYLWEFGDGNQSTELNPVHIYTDGVNGNEISLTAFNSCDTVTKTILLDSSLPPVAKIDAQSQKVCAGTTMEYYDISEGIIEERKWIFEGGEPEVTDEQNPIVQYNTTGRYDVTLIVSNSTGTDTVYQKHFITVIDVPVADFEYEIHGDSVHFIQNSVFADEYIWNFGNGTVENGKEPGTSYDESGDYTVILIARNKCGADTISKTINVVTATAEIPQSDFKVYPNPFNDAFYLQWGGELNGRMDISLTDMAGREILKKEIYIGGAMTERIGISDVSPGLYLLKLQINGRVAIVKLVKQ